MDNHARSDAQRNARDHSNSLGSSLAASAVLVAPSGCLHSPVRVGQQSAQQAEPVVARPAAVPVADMVQRGRARRPGGRVTARAAVSRLAVVEPIGPFLAAVVDGRAVSAQVTA